jgi:hypothetical protein
MSRGAPAARPAYWSRPRAVAFGPANITVFMLTPSAQLLELSIQSLLAYFSTGGWSERRGRRTQTK